MGELVPRPKVCGGKPRVAGDSRQPECNDMSKIDKIIDFSKLLHKFRSVERAVLVNDQERQENDVEHSYYMAMLAWYLISSNKFDLDINLVLKYALIHDFVEVHAGDTYIYSEDKNHLESKHSREKEAAHLLEQEWPEFEDMHELIKRYEERKDKESRFIYALDKIQPVINIYTDGGREWKRRNVTLRMLIDHKKGKINLSPEVEPYFNELVELMRAKESTLFNLVTS